MYYSSLCDYRTVKKWTLEGSPRGTGFYFKDAHIPVGLEAAPVNLRVRFLTMSAVLAEEFLL